MAEPLAKMGDVLLFHAADGEQWAKFLTNKLSSKEYNLPIRTENFRTPDFEFSAECYVQVLLLTPELLEAASKSHPNFLGLIPTRAVVVLLGVEKIEVEQLLQATEQCDHIFDCKVCNVTSDNETIKGTIVTIIETYEEFCADDDNDDIYSVPPSNKQVNQIYQVVPDHVQQGQDLFIILDRKAEREVHITCDVVDEGIVVDSLDKAVYSVKLPENAKGEINLSVVADNQPLGEERVVVESKLDRMKTLLDDVVNPVGFLCQALGLRTYTAKALDEALVQSLKSKCSPTLFHSFISIDDINFTDDRSKSMWPTPLHFAAEYNLEQFADELLKYPGMIVAACTENVNKEYPSAIAEKHGHSSLAEKLINFVLDQKMDIDSGVMDPSFFETPTPKPHRIHTKGYVPMYSRQSEIISDDDYIQMDAHLHEEITSMLSFPKPVSRLRGASPHNSPLLSGLRFRNMKAQLYGSQRSASEGDTSRLSFLSEDSSSSIPEPFPNLMKQGRPPLLPDKSVDRYSLTSDLTDSSRNTYYEDDDSDSIYNIPPPASPVINPRSPTELKSHPHTEIVVTAADPVYVQPPVQVEITESSPKLSRPTTMCISEISFDSPPTTDSSNRLSVDSDSGSQDLRSEKSSRRSLQSKISSFVRKLRPRFGSASELPKLDRANKKTKVYTKSDPGFNDQAVGSTLLAKINSEREKVSGEQERDSGSFSEEDEEKSTRSSNMKKEIKRGKRVDKSSGLIRKKSVRVTRALTENTTDAPSVPMKNLPDI